MKVQGYDIVAKEVPDKISLSIFIGGCPYHCKGCHSPWLWEDEGTPIHDILPFLLERYGKSVTCIIFMGGDQYKDQLVRSIKYIRNYNPSLKICLYTGGEIEDMKDILPFLDYIKVGKYNKELGALESPTTNQRFYALNNGEIVKEINFYEVKI